MQRAWAQLKQYMQARATRTPARAKGMGTALAVQAGMAPPRVMVSTPIHRPHGHRPHLHGIDTAAAPQQRHNSCGTAAYM